MALYNAEGWYTAMERGEVRAGDFVTGDVVNDMMNALPPARMGTSCAQLGEPYGHAADENGEWHALWLTWRFDNKPYSFGCDTWGELAIWEFCGACFAGETINRRNAFKPTQSEVIAC